MANTVTISSVKFLKRLSLYTHEKPFKIVFDVSTIPGARKTNHQLESHEVEFVDARSIWNNFTLQNNGFEFHKHTTSLTDDGFDDAETVKTRYYAEVVDFMKEHIPQASEVHVLSHQRRKRTDDFPTSTSYNIPTMNPVLYAHTDFTHDGAEVRVRQIVEQHPHLQGRSYQMVNIWRVTRGPNTDWPLAFCDYQTLNVKADMEPTDVIHRDHVGENAMVKYNPEQRWYYLDKQLEDEVVLFRHWGAEGNYSAFAPHVAFEKPDHAPQFLRESMEVRVVCFDH